MSEPTKKYLGIDWGEVRIGLAIGDSETKIATPLSVAGDVDEIMEIAGKENIDMIVIGEPLAMGNSELINKKKYLVFIDEVKSKTNLSVVTVDERLSSKAADALVGDKKSKAPRDAIAAMIILQSYFDLKL
jgi:putative holliday junction resolvase